MKTTVTPRQRCAAPTVPGCTTPILTTNTPNSVGVPSPFYPGFIVGDTSAARYLFLGVDQPKGTCNEDICSHFIRNYKRSNFYEQIRNSAFQNS